MKASQRLALLLLFLAACAVPGEVAPTPTDTQPAPTPMPAATQTPERPGLADVLVQQDYEPTFFRPEAFYAFGRVPPFTLLAGGTVIYVAEGPTYGDERVMRAKLSPEETKGLVQQVLDLGFERLETYTDMCQDQADGTQVCLADAAFTVLRARLPSGELREVKIYADFGTDPAALHDIRSLLTGYEHPSAEPYVPEHAALFIRPVTSLEGVTVQDWPLDAGLLPQASTGPSDAGLPGAVPEDSGLQGEITAVVLQGVELTRFLAAVPRNTGDFYFEHEGRFYSVYLVPWLPGFDYADALLAEFPPAGPPEAPATPAG